MSKSKLAGFDLHIYKALHNFCSFTIILIPCLLIFLRFFHFDMFNQISSKERSMARNLLKNVLLLSGVTAGEINHHHFHFQKLHVEEWSNYLLKGSAKNCFTFYLSLLSRCGVFSFKDSSHAGGWYVPGGHVRHAVHIQWIPLCSLLCTGSAGTRQLRTRWLLHENA